MPVRKRHREALAKLGYTIEERVAQGWPPEWQTEIKRGKKTVAMIVTHGCHTDDDRLRNRYQLRVAGKPTQVFKLKREAMYAWAKQTLGR